MTTETLYSISELADMFDISPRTILYYQEVGLLVLESPGSYGLQRSYTHTERRRLKLILRGKKLGFSLQEIKEMIDLYEADPNGTEVMIRIRELTNQKIREIDEKINELKLLKTEILNYQEKFLGNK